MPTTSSATARRAHNRTSLRIGLGLCRSFIAVVRGPEDLITRIALAQAFVVSSVMAMANSHAFASPMMSAGAMVAGTGLAGLLLSLGLFTRLSAATLFAFALGHQLGPDASQHNLLIMVLLGWYVLHGPGPISIDRAITVGVRASALPLSRPVMQVLDWLAKRAAPVYLLLTRLWLAVAITGLAGVSVWFPSGPFAALPFWSKALAVVLIVPGVGLPVILVVLAAGFAGMQAMHPSPQLSLYLPLFLTVLGLYGGGALTIDAVIVEWLHSHLLFDRPRDPIPAEWPHVVIVGAGFGGLACAAGLRSLPVRVTLIDRNNYHLFQPLLYQVATGSLSPADVATPIRGLFRDDRNIAVRLGAVTGVDLKTKTVMCGEDTMGYDYLVIATGARHSYFGRDEWAPFAPGLKRIEDGITARGKVLKAFELAEAATAPLTRERLLTFVIIGGGPAGVELAGAIAELAHIGLASHYREIDTAQARIVLVHSGDRVLPSFQEQLSANAIASLVRLGVEVRLNSRVTAIDQTGVAMGAERIEAATVLWAAGVVASPAAAWLGVPSDRVGRILVDGDLGIPGWPEVFVIGDTAGSLGWNGNPVPGLAPAAKQGGRYVAKVIRSRIENSLPPRPFRYRHMGSLATIGRKSAVADFGFAQLHGALAWWLWGALHLAFLVGLRNRVAVILNWAWSYLSYRVSVQLITGEVEDARSPDQRPI